MESISKRKMTHPQPVFRQSRADQEDTPPTSAFLAVDISVQRYSAFPKQINCYDKPSLTSQVVTLFQVNFKT